MVFNNASNGCSCFGCLSKACDPNSKLHRYLMLIFICFLSFGSYFCYDNPAALQDIFVKDLHLSVSQYMNLYAFYSWPNVILSFIGGFLVDRVFGVRWGAILFSLIIFLGQLLFALGAFCTNTGLMYFARFVFGIGGESLAVAQNTYATLWFKPNEINFVFGLTLSMARIGSTANMNTMQHVFNALSKYFGANKSKAMGFSLLVASTTCVLSSLCAFSISYFYKRFKRFTQDVSIDERESASQNYGSINGVAITNNSNDPLIVQPSSTSEEKIRLSDIWRFPVSIWLICVICVAYYVTIFPFISLGLVFFERKYELSAEAAAAVNSLLFVISAIASPVFGAAIDCLGRNLFWIAFGITLTGGCHACFAFTQSSPPPSVVMIFMGFAYSILASSLWPLVGVILPQHQRATAYGLIQSVQNLGLGLISILAGYIVDVMGYFALELFFLNCLLIAFGAVAILYVWDLKNGTLLNPKKSISCCRRI